MEMSKINFEIIHEGWLIKSPPTKLWRARWRKRWFMLQHNGEFPRQYFLEYYTDKKCQKLKGKIDLDQCEQVDAGLRFENQKQKYQFMFNVKTPKRVYYLVAENGTDMNKWVDAVCQVCGLKAQDGEQQLFPFESQESPPISPASTISGAYIPISECRSGRSVNNSSSFRSTYGQGLDHYDAPRKLVPSPPISPTTTDAESVLTDDEWMISAPCVNWDTFPSSSNLKTSNPKIGSWSICKRFGKLKIYNSIKSRTVDEAIIPPRPPKPSHMILKNQGHNYINFAEATENSKLISSAIRGQITSLSLITDDSYDFPRSHQPVVMDQGTIKKQLYSKHCYTNAAPSNTNETENRIFRYDFQDDELSSSHLETSIIATHSNLSSPLTKCEVNVTSSSSNLQSPVTSSTAVLPTILNSTLTPSPLIYQELKLGIMSGTADVNLYEHSHPEPPNINRKLKPQLNKSSHERVSRFQSTSDEDNEVEDKERYPNNFVQASCPKCVDLQYLDLDLEISQSFNTSALPLAQLQFNSTVYKTVDFLKTEAFNRTRQKVEEERKQLV